MAGDTQSRRADHEPTDEHDGRQRAAHARHAPDHHYVLRLYVAGTKASSQRAIENLRELCDSELAGRHELHVIDVYQQPALAANEQIVAAPTLVKEQPLPVRRLIGDMSDRDRVLTGLDIPPPRRASWPPRR